MYNVYQMPLMFYKTVSFSLKITCFSFHISVFVSQVLLEIYHSRILEQVYCCGISRIILFSGHWQLFLLPSSPDIIFVDRLWPVMRELHDNLLSYRSFPYLIRNCRSVSTSIYRLKCFLISERTINKTYVNYCVSTTLWCMSIRPL